MISDRKWWQGDPGLARWVRDPGPHPLANRAEVPNTPPWKLPSFSGFMEDPVLRSSPKTPWLVFCLLLLFTGCVKKSTHQGTLDQLDASRTEQAALAARMETELQRRDDRETRLREQLDDLEAEIDRLIEDLGGARRQNLRTEAELEETRLEAQRLQALLSAQGAQSQQLQYRLNQLSAIEQEIRERNQIYEEVLDRFRSLIDAGRLSVSIARGRMVINLPQDILFASGSADLGSDGRGTLAEVAEVLAEFTDRSFQVEGHTDDRPISTTQFPSNWELSAARALSVVKLLVDRGVPADNLSGAGYGEYHPVALNETSDGRRLNRRIEIVMLPNLDVIAEAQAGG